MNKQSAPSKQGQIVKISNPTANENAAEVYLIIEDIAHYADNRVLNIVSLTELQRNIANPLSASRKAIKKSELTVVADDLTAYVESWNK